MSALLLLCLAAAVLALVGDLGDRLGRRWKARWERRYPLVLVRDCAPQREPSSYAPHL